MIWIVIFILIVVLAVLISYVNSLSKSLIEVSKFSNGLAWKLKEKGLIDKNDIDWIGSFMKGETGLKAGMLRLKDFMNDSPNSDKMG